ncbi:MAG: YscO family type III secretion system apparatus protein [Desulfobacterium sp.]|nr:YscO family type III secretion system apparatus protein [Desulfobacterium sp.]
MKKQYPLAALLHLREFRQDKAMHALQGCERKLSAARRGVKKAVNTHEEFMDWLAREEEIRYQGIMETQMTLEEVADFKAGLLTIRGRESRYLEEILKARNQVQVCETDVKKAKSALLAAQKGTMKIEVHQERWFALEKLDAERAEELEMEDFTPLKNDIFGESLNV